MYLGGEGVGLVVGGGELTGVDLPATGILGLGLLSYCDGFPEITSLCCGVTGGFPTEGVSSGVGSAGLTGVYSVS